MKNRVILFAVWMLALGAADAQPVVETGSVSPMPERWVDRDTRHTVIRLSRREGNNGSFYFHNNPFVGNRMVFYHTEGRDKQIYTVDLGTLEAARVTEQASPMNGEIVAVRSRRVFYQIKDSVFSTNIDTRETKLVFIFPADFKGSVATLNADETMLAGVQSGDEAKEILRQFPEKRDFFNRIYDAHIRHTLFTIDVGNGVLKKIHSEDTWIGHVQFSPTDPALLMFCHEGPWQKVDRIWTIDVGSRIVKLMHKRTVENEIAGHEFWGPDGRTIWFDWQIPKGQTFFLGGVDVRTGEEKKYGMTRDEWSIHFNISPDQRWFAGDGGDSGQVAKAKDGRWIYLFHTEGGRLVSEKLVNMKGQYYKLEPNVHFSPDGKWVIFRANFEGKEAIYAVDAFEKKEVAEAGWPAVTQTARPWTRWWWMGSAVDKQDLTANMEKYRAVGLGGLELTPIYGVKGYEDRSISYLSPAWVEMLRHTLKEAGRLGLGIDMATGTGWPFGGGPLVDGNYACKNFVYKRWTVQAGEGLKDTVRYVQEALVRTDGALKPGIGDLAEPVYANKDLQSLALFQVRFAKPLPLQTLMAYSSRGKTQDLTGKVDAGGRLQWKAPAGEGDWQLYAIFQGWHGKMVERAAPGGEGNVIDHFSGAALKRYLSRWDTALAARDLSGLRAFFNDSYEVDDAKGQSNWTPGLFELFRSYRGYDLREHLKEFLGGGQALRGGGTGKMAGGGMKGLSDTGVGTDARVLCDYRETISDLLLDQFTRGWGAWARGKGAVIRNQAHGAPANILDLYAASDIPETEGSDVLRYKFASSAGDVMGKRLVSSESATWLDEHFRSSLADVKKALDGNWLGGVNHIFYHGTAYSPAGDPWPGWLFYAAVHFTPNDPCWQDFSQLNGYVARTQSFLQEGRAENDVLLYYPVYDSWMDAGQALLKHYDKETDFDVAGFKECAEGMLRRGYAFDYISDRQVRELGAADRPAGEGDGVGGTAIKSAGGGNYQAVLLPGCKYISPAAFSKLVQLAEDGAVVLVYQGLPVDVPGLTELAARRDTLKGLLGGLHFMEVGGGVVRAAIGKGAFIKSDDLEALLAYARIRREAMVEDSLHFVRRAVEGGHCYFVVNRAGRKWEGWVTLAADHAQVVLFDPMSERWGVGRTKGQGVFLRLLPGESMIVRTFSKSVPGVAMYPYYRAVGEGLELKGEWKLDFMEGGPTLPASVRVRELGSWTKLEGEDVKRFSGVAKYTLSFDKPAGPAKAWMLDLGKVDLTARVVLNGHAVGVLIGPYYQVVLPDSLVAAHNVLEVFVANGMANRIGDMDRRGVVWKKFYNYNFPAHVRENRGADGLFSAAGWKPQDAGLSGPVTLTAVDRATGEEDKLPEKKAVLASMRRANAYFMKKWPDPGKEIVTNKTRPSNIWTRAVYYEGLMAMYAIDKQKEYYDYAVDWGNKHQWTPRSGVTGRNADDQCCGQTYIDLYGIDPKPERIAAIKSCIDNMLPGEKCDDWNWIDAIQMAMPVFTRLGVVYKDTAYFRKMYDLYHYTKVSHGVHGLYNPEEHLWWRDKDFVPPYKEPNGGNCYWSRGNGWVLAALVRVLSLLPADDVHRQEYYQDYLDMVKALAPLQRGDGYWNVSLRDPSHFGGKELTGTALFTYGIAWGIRQGYLDRKKYLPVVTRAWNAMAGMSLQESGFLGYVQGTGKEPADGQPVGPDKAPDFEDYGLGCFLLAGSEVYRLAGRK